MRLVVVEEVVQGYFQGLSRASHDESPSLPQIRQGQV